MKNKGYFIKILPATGGKGKNWFISHKILNLLKIFILILIVTIGFFVLKYGSVYRSAMEVQILRSKLKRMEARVEMIDKLEKRIALLNGFVDKIKNMLTPSVEKVVARIPLNNDLSVSLSADSSSFFIIPVQGIVSQGFSKLHPGIDIVAPTGTPVVAPFDGVVKEAGFTTIKGFFIELENKNGYDAKLLHMRRIFMRRGDKVKKGELIGEVGSTGKSTGPHLHYEIWKNNLSVNPLSFIPEPPLFSFFNLRGAFIGRRFK